MGGKSTSNKSTSSNQTNHNYVNDGEFAGAGNVSIDESDHSIEDSYNTETNNDIALDIDSSINDSYNQEYEIDNSTSLEDSYNTDNSTSLEDSNNTDNSIEVGDGNFAGRDITMIDAGAIKAAEEIAKKALEESTRQNAAANDLSSRALDANERISSDAIRGVENVSSEAMATAKQAIDEVADIADMSVSEVGETSQKIIEGLKSASEVSFAKNTETLQQISEQSGQDKAVIAELAKNTSLAGQDIVAKSSEKMTMYMALAMGVGFLAVAFAVMRGSK